MAEQSTSQLNESEDQIEKDSQANANDFPSAESMLARLNSVNIEAFDIQLKMDELKGKWNWIFVLTMPISALLLVSLTLLGLFFADSFVISFIISSGIVFSIAKVIDGYEQQYRSLARKHIMKTIAEIEDDIGLIHNFKEFLPKKYRHLWQCVRKKNFIYIEQYTTAIRLLQSKLEHEKFIKLWHFKYPMTDPEYVRDKLEEEADEKKRKDKSRARR